MQDVQIQELKEFFRVSERKYKFSWDLIGDLQTGRPNLGPTARLEVYRLMQFAFRDILEKHYGTKAADDLFYEAGKMAGEEFFKKFLSNFKGINEYIKELQRLLKEMGIGILRIEKADIEKGEFILTVSEDLDCSGLPELDYVICVYDEGFIAGLMESFTGRRFKVKEVDCWCIGDRICRFVAEVY